ncbi:hypothetical protein FHS16_005815 [Paenibacillus endophyticus]|uniref:Uncharacterized protein n=1 Tax=Paenibacillus endophyticus TaxID=1294268 RepID=A0A7W5CDN6_9BACL|nr:hypothetical protein [Paenibacillus endophyticus]
MVSSSKEAVVSRAMQSLRKCWTPRGVLFVSVRMAAVRVEGFIDAFALQEKVRNQGAVHNFFLS